MQRTGGAREGKGEEKEERQEKGARCKEREEQEKERGSKGGGEREKARERGMVQRTGGA